MESLDDLQVTALSGHRCASPPGFRTTFGMLRPLGQCLLSCVGPGGGGGAASGVLQLMM